MNKYRAIIIVLLTLLLVNPLLLYFLTNNFIISFTVPLVNSILSFLTFSKYPKTFVFQYFISIFIFISTTSELVFRINFDEYKINNLYETKDHFYFNKGNMNLVIDDVEYQTIFKTNEYGYRIANFQSKMANPDWLFIGDSYTQGAQVNFNELYTTQLANKIKQKTILNAGVSGFSLYEEFELIKNEFKYYKPEIVFLQLCVLNDFEIVQRKKRNVNEWLIEKSELFRFLYYNNIYDDNNDKLNKRWVLPFLPNDTDNINCNILYKTTSSLKTEMLNSVELYLRKIATFLKENNSRMVVILIPTKEQVYPEYLNEVLIEYNIDSSNLDVFNASNYIKNKAQNIGFEFIDPIFEFKKDTTMLYFKTDEHLNVLGHKKLSECIAKYMYPNCQTIK